MSASIYEIAVAYVEAGLSVIPVGVDGQKRPAYWLLPEEFDENDGKTKAVWYPFQFRLPNPEELEKWFRDSRPGTVAIAVVAGGISGGAECVDVDQPALVRPFLDAIKADDPALFDRLVVVESGGGGCHVWYRSPEIEGSQKLAWPAKGTVPFKALIETRGEGGYAVAPGSPVETHKDKRPYVFLQRDLTQIPDVTEDERNYLIRLARSFDEHGANQEPPPPPETGPTGQPIPGLSPADDYDRRGPSLDALLAEAGARLASGTWDRGMVVRPGKERGPGATVGYSRGKHGEPLLHVFTSSWPPFEPGKNYGRFHVLRLLKFKGDGRAAMRWCREQGYGDPLPPKAQPSTNGHANGQVNGHANGQVNGQTKAVPPGPRPAVVAALNAAPAAPEAWDTPLPLESTPEPPAAFPMDCLPEKLRPLVVDIAEAVNCAVDYPGVYVLGLASGAVGATRVVEIKPGYCESACVYLAAVGVPGSGKSPPLKELMRPVNDEQEKRRKEKSKEPAYVADVTVEKVAVLLKDCPRGLLLCRDELSGWIMSMNQYKASKGAGADRKFYLSAWSGEPVNVERKDPTAEPVYVRYPHVTVVGTIQPDVLTDLRGSNDGFYDRILFVHPPATPAVGETWRSIDPGQTKAWAEAYRLLMSTKMIDTENGGKRPYYHRMNADARKGWEAWTAWVADKLNGSDFPEHLRGPLVKLRGYAARLALVSHALREACLETAEAEVDGESMRRGVELAKYFFTHMLAVHRVFRCDPRIEAARKVLSWVRTWDAATFSARDVHRSLRRSFERREDLYPPLKVLEQFGYVRYEEAPYAGTGRKPSVRYEINPRWDGWESPAADRARCLYAQPAAQAEGVHAA